MTHYSPASFKPLTFHDAVPRFLAGTLAPQVEKFVVVLVRPNLEQMNVSLGRYLDSRA